MKFSELTKCPYCGYEEFYTHQSAKGTFDYNERFDGKEADNSEMWSGMQYNYGSRCYCGNCDKYLGDRFKDVVSKGVEQKLEGLKNEKN